MPHSQDIALPMDLDMNHSPLMTDHQKTPSSSDIHYDLEDELFQFSQVTAGSSSLASFPNISSESSSEAAFQSNMTGSEFENGSYQSAENFFSASSDTFPHIFGTTKSYQRHVPCYPTEDVPETNILKAIQPCTNQTESCMTQALKIFKNLHVPSTLCLSVCGKVPSATMSSPQTTDSILTANRQAIQAVSRIVNCTCSLNVPMQLVLVAIYNKLVVWYNALLPVNCNNDPFPSRSSPLAAHSSGTKGSTNSIPTFDQDDNREDYSKFVVNQPLLMGEYVFEPSLENKLRVQVVQSELKMMNYLRKILHERIQETRLDTSACYITPTSTTSEVSSDYSNNSTDIGCSGAEIQIDEASYKDVAAQSLVAFLEQQLQHTNEDSLMR
ncbi:hypothetical protein BGW36DRAFT_432194 [Talaromyces proteolyticus]|uniref:Aflatoxin regulatory protein domain-containing protein n=1 Tax=Talaromyces proteolyticus TaxID=1131652 RepID=A0AAD4KH61_9EURO|nr:uncharacterized protein BGW36DRAFT_432194 [Talaromyces proteolyticus]KAH8691646.1 hypothetical protein BGW36DRAFT_432194 [Talaromyces proteolyticus]